MQFEEPGGADDRDLLSEAALCEIEQLNRSVARMRRGAYLVSVFSASVVLGGPPQFPNGGNPSFSFMAFVFFGGLTTIFFWYGAAGLPASWR